MPGLRARDCGGDVAVRGNSNLRPGTLAPFCSGSLRCQPTGLPCDEFEKFSVSSTNVRCPTPGSPPVAKGSVANYLASATDAGLTHREAQALDDAALSARLHPQRYVYPQFAVPDFGEIHRELRRCQ